MKTEFVPVSGLALMFILGLRHGLDPDHIAMIDCLAYRSLAERPRVAPWIGTLFALGHGLTATLIAVVLSSVAGNLSTPISFSALVEWLPIVLLLVVGTLNLYGLLGRRDYHATGWKTRFVPERLRSSFHPLSPGIQTRVESR